MTPAPHVDLRTSEIPWIDAVPHHWEQTQLRAVFSPKRVKNTGMLEDHLLSLSYGRIVPRDIGSSDGLLPESYETYQIVDPDDIIFRFTDLQNDKRSLRSARVTERGIITSAYVAVCPVNIHARYAEYLMRSYDTSKVFYGLGGGVRQTLKFADVALLPVLLPPLPEQRAIADYLDRETQRIDELIAEQRGLIETLRERRVAVIRAGVSGVQHGGDILPEGDWFGRLPDGWPATPIIYDFSVVLGKMLNSGKLAHSEPVKAPYLTAGSIQPNTLVLDVSKVMNFTESELDRYSLRCGDVVVVEGGAGYGRSYYLANGLNGWGFQNHVARVRPATSRARGRFVDYCLKACLASGYIEANNRTATLPSLSREVLGSIRIPRPPVDIQESIADELDDQTSRIDALIAESDDLIALSQERRAALITAAVTGQIDVRTAA